MTTDKEANDSSSSSSPSPPTAKRQRQSSPTPPSSHLTLYNPSTDPPPPSPTHPNLSSLRTSSLSSPTLKLTGHRSSVYALSYSPNGDYLISSSFDTTCLLWSHSDTGSYENLSVYSGTHTNAVLDVAFSSDGDYVVTGGADCILGWWDVGDGGGGGGGDGGGRRIKKFVGHGDVVNGVATVPGGWEGGGSVAGNVGRMSVASASDDRTVRLWDARVRGDVGVLEHEYQVTAVCYGMDGGCTLYSAGIDNLINAWDVRMVGGGGAGGKGGAGGGDGGGMGMTMRMKGHGDTVTGLSLSPKGTHLLSNSMDGTLKTWDIRPFVEDGGRRQKKTFVGGTHNAEKGLLNCAWSADGSMVTGGSADKIVHIWDVLTTEELYYLPGHTGCVNSVIFHPKENVIASASSDKSIFVGELSG